MLPFKTCRPLGDARLCCVHSGNNGAKLPNSIGTSGWSVGIGGTVAEGDAIEGTAAEGTVAEGIAAENGSDGSVNSVESLKLARLFSAK